MVLGEGKEANKPFSPVSISFHQTLNNCALNRAFTTAEKVPFTC